MTTQKIQFNKVTWYSKLAAVIFFIGILPAWTFYLGTQYEKTIVLISTVPYIKHSVAKTHLVMYKNESLGLSLEYPSDWTVHQDDTFNTAGNVAEFETKKIINGTPESYLSLQDISSTTYPGPYLGTDLNEWVTNYAKNFDDSQDILNTKIKINIGVGTTTGYYLSNPKSTGNSYSYLFIPHGRNILTIDGNITQEDPVYQEIISSIKFTK